MLQPILPLLSHVCVKLRPPIELGLSKVTLTKLKLSSYEHATYMQDPLTLVIFIKIDCFEGSHRNLNLGFTSSSPTKDLKAKEYCFGE